VRVFQALLTELSALGPSELRAWVAAHRPRLTFSFLSWLADRRACSLPALCGLRPAVCARLRAPVVAGVCLR